jgi:hypothetical protein
VGHRQERTIYWGGGRAFGGTVAAPIWAAFMKAALAGQPQLNFAKAASPRYTPSKFKVIGGTRGPDIKGMLLDAAVAKLESGGYDYTIQYVTSNLPKGTVVGVKVTGTKLTVQVSKGPVAPPIVVPPPPPSGGGTTTPGGNTTTTPTP